MNCKNVISILLLCLPLSVWTANEKSLTKAELLHDYDYYFEQLQLIHPDPYSAFKGKEGFDVAVNQLRGQLVLRDTLTLNEMQFEVNMLLSALHDGHTHMGWPTPPTIMENKWIPLQFRVIPDEIIVNGTSSDYQVLEGAKLLEVENIPLKEIFPLVDRLAITENNFGLAGNVCNIIRNNNGIHLLFPQFSKDNLTLKLKMDNRQDTVVTLPFYPEDKTWDTFITLLEDKRFPKDNFAYRFADAAKNTMVMSINSIMSADIPGYKDSKIIVADVFHKMLLEMKAAHSNQLIIDLRGNGGGYAMIMYAALYEIYGEEFLKTDMGVHFSNRISDAYLKKKGMTLEQFNQRNCTHLNIGDFMENDTRISSLDMFMCANRDILISQNGQPVYIPKEIYVVTDENTFSAAFHLAFMMRKMGARIVGVPSGQSPNTFMENTEFTLPNSGSIATVSNSVQTCFPKDHPMAKVFTPDIQLKYEDYRKFGFSKDAELLYLLEMNDKRQ